LAVELFSDGLRPAGVNTEIYQCHGTKVRISICLLVGHLTNDLRLTIL
jgi:hypothetical protein